MDISTTLADRAAGLVQRLFDAFAQQVSEIEARVNAQDSNVSDDAKVLGGLAKTLETLISLAQRSGTTEGGPDIDGARAELADRLARLLTPSVEGVNCSTQS